MGNGVVEALKKEFDIEDEWVSLEIHPETPPEGMSLADRFPAASLQAMYDNLRRMGEPFEIQFGEMNWLSNSHLALEASEFARDHGKFHEFHERIFYLYFTAGRDIGDLNVLLDAAEELALNRAELQQALEDHRYAPRLEQAQMESARYGITGTPTFIINGRYKVSGAQPLESFRNILRQIEQREQADESI